MMENKHVGADFDDFLDEQGIREEVEIAAIKKVIASMIEQAMDDAHVSKGVMAKRMRTSRAQLDRLLDPASQSMTLTTLVKAARAINKKVCFTLDDRTRGSGCLT